MHETLGRLHQHNAYLEASQVRATLSWQNPSGGLTDLCWGNTKIPGAGLLGLKMAPDFLTSAGLKSEGYCRGVDLIAAYEQSQTLPGRVDALWRMVNPQPGDTFLSALDLIVSVRTYLLESRPEIAVESRLPAVELMRLADTERAEFTKLSGQSAKPLILSSEDGPGCVLFRTPDSEISYAEMVHPIDFQKDELQADSSGGKSRLLKHRLFTVPLEKGVMLRCRVRGAFLNRRGDTTADAACYRSFAARPILA